MVLPAPDVVDKQMSEARSGITLDMVVQFIQDAPPEFREYLFQLLTQEDEPVDDPALDAAMESVAPGGTTPPPIF